MTVQGSRVSQAADALVALSRDAPAGTYLGAEDDLLKKLGVSRPTLRQAAKIVESDKMIAVRRGSKGGVYATRPEAADVIRAPAHYLRLNGATVADVHAVTRRIAEDMGAAAAGCADPALRARLAAFRTSIDRNDTPAALVDAETVLARLLAEMCGNPATMLFIEIGYTFGRGVHDMHFYATAEDRERARVLQRGLCDAVLAHDAEIARLMMQRRSAMISEWLARE
jgi:GntR family transcriptional regulator, transcriptional repressor for pyruvate dehydrogenase complex